MTRMYASREAAKKTESKRAWDGKPRGIQGSFPRDWQDSRVNVSNPLRGPSPFAAPTAAPIQRKATVSVPSDPLEKAADEGAEKLLRMEEPAFENGASGTIQRKCASCEDEDETNKIHAKRDGGTNDSAAMDTSSAIAAAQRPGLPLPGQTRAFFEPRMGADLSGVRIHTDAEAARAAAGVQAKAYTWRDKIVFGAGEYAPETDSGKRLLAHELMHWRQQAGGAGGVVQRKEGDPPNCGKHFKREFRGKINAELPEEHNGVPRMFFANIPTTPKKGINPPAKPRNEAIAPLVTGTEVEVGKREGYAGMWRAVCHALPNMPAQILWVLDGYISEIDAKGESTGGIQAPAPIADSKRVTQKGESSAEQAAPVKIPAEPIPPEANAAALSVVRELLKYSNQSFDAEVMTAEDARRIMTAMIRTQPSLSAYGPYVLTLRLLRDIVMEGVDIPITTLALRIGKYRHITIMRPDGYFAWVRNGEALQRFGEMNFVDERPMVGGLEVGQFFYNNDGVLYRLGTDLKRSGPPVGELGLEHDLPNKMLDGVGDSLEAMAQGVARLLRHPIQSIADLAQLPRALMHLIMNSPQYWDRFKAMPLGDQVREVSKHLTTLVTMYGTATGTTTRLMAAAADLESVTVNALWLVDKGDRFAWATATVPVGTIATAISGGPGGIYILHMANQGENGLKGGAKTDSPQNHEAGTPAKAEDTPSVAPNRGELLKQLDAAGVKHNAADIVAIEKFDGRIVFLEKGTSKAGLIHIITKHAADFARRGITEAEIPDVLFAALRKGKQVGMQGTRPIYEFTFKGKEHRVAITVGNNGFIVGANPATH